MLKLMLFGLILHICQSSKLNVPKLLLPYYSNIAVNFTLEVSDGCFTWRSTRPEIVTVNQGKDDKTCSQTALVTATSRVPTRKTAVVIAENQVSGHQLRCDVIVDEIHYIAIETTTHELYLDDSPEEFVIRAMNEEDDVFSTVEGLAFEWNLLPDTIIGKNLAAANNILRFIPYFESAYEALPHIKSLESLGKRGDRILVRGIRTGSARVSVKPVDAAHKQFKDSVVRIVVMANIQLSPPLVYLMPHTTVKYNVELIKQNKVHVVQMPSEQYYLSVEDETLVSFDEKISTATALEMGSTDVLLNDRHINMDGMFRTPTATIYIVSPGYLEFQVFPDPNWVLQTNHIYEVTIDIYDKESHKIFPSDNVRIEATFPTQYFDVQKSSVNGTYHIVKTLLNGTVDIHGILAAVILENGEQRDFNPTIQNSQEVEIYDPVVVLPKILVLPWVPSLKSNYVFQLEATGGSGNYTWTSSKQDVATANTKGQVVTGTVTGHTNVKASDSKNIAHFDTMQTFVLPPSEMEFLPSRVETQIGSNLNLPLAVYGKLRGKLQRFDECYLMPLEIIFADEGVFTHVEVTEPLAKGSCANIKVNGLSQGHTQIQVKYLYKEVSLKAVVTIAAYKPLKPVDPEEITLVTPGASRDITFDGGPQPWILDPSKYSQLLGAEQMDWIDIKPIRKMEGNKSRHMFRVLCTALGEQILSLTVANGPTAKNQFPASATAEMRFACAQPKAIHLIPLVKHPKGLPPCPINPLYDDPVPVHSYKNLDMQITLQDELGRQFDNFSSLALDWKISDSTMANFVPLKEDQNILMEEKPNLISYRTMSMKGNVGFTDVTVTVLGYSDQSFVTKYLLSKLDLITDTRTLHLVADSSIEPKTVTIYNFETNKVNASLHVLDGSGHFYLDQTFTNVSKFNFDEKKPRDIKILPMKEGQFTVIVQDLCVEGLTPTKASILVSDIHKIDLQVVDKVEIEKEIKAEVKVFDKLGHAIPARYFSHMSLIEKIGTDIINVRPYQSESQSDGEKAFYIVRGIVLGRTTLQITAKQKVLGRFIASPAREIQVFPPLKLHPRNITLIIGAQFQVIANGGPQPQSTIEFSIRNSKIATVSSTGLLEALELGNSRILGEAVGTDGANNRVVYSRDEVNVNVIVLEGIRIYAPLKRLQSETKMPLYAVGLTENETPFTFGSSAPPLSFEWSISNNDVATLNPLFHNSGIVPGAEHNFAVRLFALEAGHVTVKLTVRGLSDRQIRNKQKLTDSVQIQVFERLRLVSPPICNGKLLVTPDTETNIFTNRDGSTTRISYTIQSHNQTQVTVDDSGHLISGSSTGETSLIITSHEEFGVNQTIVVLVQVKPVSYVMINSATVINTYGGELSHVPIGSALHFTISFHDAVGEEFFATNIKIRYSSNRYDILQIDHGQKNSTLQAKATNLGHTVLKVWDSENLRLADYVDIGVGEAILPQLETFHLGDIICFHSPIVTSDGHAGLWLTDNKVIQIDEDKGFGLVTQVGMSHLIYNISSSISTYTTVQSEAIKRIELQNEQVSYMSNYDSPYNPKKISVAVDLITSEGLKYSSVIGQNCSEKLEAKNYVLTRYMVRCELSLGSHHSHIGVEDLARVHVEFDVTTGKYQCIITQIETSSDLNPVISSLATDLQLKAIVMSRHNQPEVVSQSLSIPYVPAFHVQPTRLMLSTEQPNGRIRVTMVDKLSAELKVTSDDPSLVSVSGPERDHQGNQVFIFSVLLHVSISLWDRPQLETTIEVLSSLTGQQQTIPVKIKLIGTKEGQPKAVFSSWTELINAIANNYQSIILTLIYIILTIACIVIAYHVILGQKYQTASNQSGVFIQPQPSPNTSGVVSPQFQFNSSFANSVPNFNGSPTSPKRLWSVDYGPYDGSFMYKKSPQQNSKYS